MFDKYKRNWAILRREIMTEGARFERMSYDQLLRPAEEISTSRVVDGVELFFSAEAYNIDSAGVIHFCIDVSGLPTFLGIKPSYQFKKRRDGSVFY